MKFFLEFLCLFWMSRIILIAGVDIWYQDLKDLNATCFPDDSCIVPRTEDSPGILWSHACSCNRLCSLYGTCCIDSRYKAIRQPELRPSCRSLRLSFKGLSYFVIDKCSLGDSSDFIWEKLCEDEWFGEDDIMRLVPVTSVFSTHTYKNYFCFRCHERTNDFFYWNVFMQSNFTYTSQTDIRYDRLTYSFANKSWMVPDANNDIWIKVDIKFQIPDEIWSLPVECESELISHCNDKWWDNGVREKCGAYTGIVYIQRDGMIFKYRNAHCALCNYESLDKILCKSRCAVPPDTSYGGVAYDKTNYGGAYGQSNYSDVMINRTTYASEVMNVTEASRMVFSFTHLLDINRKDGNRVGKIQICQGNFLWDPFARRCRRLTCALPGYVIKNRKCVPRGK